MRRPASAFVLFTALVAGVATAAPKSAPTLQVHATRSDPLAGPHAALRSLQFDKAGKVEVEFPIAAIGAPAPGAAAGGGTMMQGGGMMQMKPQH